MLIRDERPGDEEAIRQLVEAAFRDHPHSDQREHHLIDALRSASALTLSLVAEEDGAPIGHIAFSPVTIGGTFHNWYGLAPVAVTPARQHHGIGLLHPLRLQGPPGTNLCRRLARILPGAPVR
jgi:putative acetyltransferase